VWLRQNVGQASGLSLRQGGGRSDAGLSLADVAFTLQIGRRAFEKRRIVVARDADEAIELLEEKDSRRVFTQGQRNASPPVVFMFPGQGAHYVNMGRELYETEPVFRDEVDRCCDLLTSHLKLDLRTLLYPAAGEEESARAQLTQTAMTQPALFVIEHALAKLWISWGVKPAAMVGHSVGEFVAAVLADVMSLEDGLTLLAARARFMQEQPSGAMLSVRLPEEELQPLLNDKVTIAVINSPKSCVVSGPHAAVEVLRAELEQRSVACKQLHTSHAFHSPMMEPIVGPFTEGVQQVTLRPAQVPIVSTSTGKWIEPGDWTDPTYWAKQLRHTVRFADAVATLAQQPNFILLEVGPGQTLATLVQQHPAKAKEQLVLPSMPPIEKTDEHVALLTALGRLWLAGVAPDWNGFHAHERRKRVPLPSYPFERQRYWIAPPKPARPRKPVADVLSCAASGPAQNGQDHAGEASERLPAAASSGAWVEEIIRRQLRVMGEQLEALRTGGQ